MHWSSNPPPPPLRINSKEVLARWCADCFSDMLSWKSGAFCVCNNYSLRTKKAEICARWNYQPHLVLRFKSACWGNKYMCVRNREMHFYVKERGPIEFVILFLSHFLPKNTLSWNKWVAIQCHCVSQHEIIEECNYHFAQQTFLWNESEQLRT